MSSRKSMQRQVMYNRQSKAWQQNQMKNRMAEAGYAKGAPKALNEKKLRIWIIVAMIVFIGVTVLLTMKLKWWGILFAFVIGGLMTGGFLYYMKSKEKDIMRYYKTMGIPKNEFFKQMKRNSKTPIKDKQLKKMQKVWDNIQVKQ